MATSALIGSKVHGGSLISRAVGDESGPGQATGRWAVMEADILGPQTAWAIAEPCSSPARLLQGSLWPVLHSVLHRWGLIGWDPGRLPVCEDREIRLAMSDYSKAESDSVIWPPGISRLTHWERGREEEGLLMLSEAKKGWSGDRSVWIKVCKLLPNLKTNYKKSMNQEVRRESGRRKGDVFYI